MKIREKFFGNKQFYSRVVALALPIVIQNGITNFVNLLDNIMVGSLGTEQMSGVSIVNQFIFIFNLLIYGAISGAGIFCVQYHGTNNPNGVQQTFRFKLYSNILLSSISIGLFAAFGGDLISTFLFESGTGGDLALTLSQGREYLQIMLIGLVPYAISQVYASTLRETEHTVVPMVASVVAVFVNFILNYILIFGNLGFSPLGVKGAAIATVISRFAELLILLVWSHRHTDKCIYFKGVFKSFAIPSVLVKRMIVKALPLMTNELLWSISLTLRNQCYATRGIDAVAAQNICSTIFNVFSVIYMAFGTVISIMVGNLLGQGRFEEARDTNRKVLVCSVFCGITLGTLLVLSSGIFPQLYNTDENVKSIAAYMMIISGIYMPFYAFSNSSYFTIRSGGSVGITFLMDSGFMCLFMLPVSFVVSRFTDVSIFVLFAICQGAETLKAFVGFIMIQKTRWTKRLVGDQ